jgi:sterol desaturase/sphingolipid hydroxylase (fatty acid hydroxylase superfamily)
MSALGWIIYLIGAVLAFWLARSLINVRSRYRTGAAIVLAILWPALLALIAAFMLADAIEWSVKRIRRRWRL